MPGVHWTKAEVEQLHRLLTGRRDVARVIVPGRSVFAIRNKALRLKLIGNGISRRPWQPGEELGLRRLSARGCTPHQIVREGLLHNQRTVCAVAQKVRRCALADPMRSARAYAAAQRRFAPRLRALFHEFLRDNARAYTPEQLALRWNQRYQKFRVSRDKVIYHLGRLGIKQPWSVVIRMPFSRLKRKRHSAKFVAAQQRRWKRYRQRLLTNLRQRAAQLRAEAQRRAQPIRERTCTDCPSSWPLAHPFFVAHHKRTKHGADRLTYSHACRLCWNARRRGATNNE